VGDPLTDVRVRRGPPRRRLRSGFQAGLVLGSAAASAAPGLIRLARSWSARVAVTGTSMVPALRPGDWLLVDPTAYANRPPTPGDVVVVPDPRHPGRLLVKRVHASGPDGRLELAGDAPDSSTDSRTFGPVDPGHVLGRAWARYWPPQRIGRLPRPRA
jgi:nickel-type superoxide dismutase maturation protease